MQEKYGFVYVWMDKKKGRFYVGSHWGHEKDGYICSSRWMRNTYKRRPGDFKRRIVFRTIVREDLLPEEGRWLQMIKREELGVRYYNLNATILPGHWSSDEHSRTVVGQKLSVAGTGKKQSPETAAKRSAAMKEAWASGKMRGMTGKTHSDEYKERLRRERMGKKIEGERLENMRVAAAKRRGVPTGRSSDAQRSAVSTKMKEMWRDPEYRNKMTAISRSVRHTPESRALISASLRGHVVSDETRKKISDTKLKKRRV